MPSRRDRAPRLLRALMVVTVALAVFGSLAATCGASPSSPTPSDASSADLSPTPDFFRGRSYPTPTAQPSGAGRIDTPLPRL